jgi:hypothetical protein
MNPLDYPQIFGQHFATRANQPVLQIGQRAYTRYDLGQLGCPHIHAARTLDSVLRQLNIRSLEDLVRHHSPEEFVGIKGFGVTTFYVLLCVLRAAKFNLREFYKAKTTVTTLQEHVRKQEHVRQIRRAS